MAITTLELRGAIARLTAHALFGNAVQQNFTNYQKTMDDSLLLARFIEYTAEENKYIQVLEQTLQTAGLSLPTRP